MNSQTINTTGSNTRRVRTYRNRLHSQGVKRVEVRIPAQDVPLVHNIAGILRTGGNEAAILREHIQQATGDDEHTTGKDLITFLRNSGLSDVDLDLERDKSTSRTVTLE